MNKFVIKMLELGAELDKAASPIQISMVLNDAEILYKNHIKQLIIDGVVGQSEQLKALEDLKQWCFDTCQPFEEERLHDILKRL